MKLTIIKSTLRLWLFQSGSQSQDWDGWKTSLHLEKPNLVSLLSDIIYIENKRTFVLCNSVPGAKTSLLMFGTFFMVGTFEFSMASTRNIYKRNSNFYNSISCLSGKTAILGLTIQSIVCTSTTLELHIYSWPFKANIRILKKCSAH